MKTVNFFRSALSALAIAIFAIIAIGSTTEANAQCLAPADVVLVPAPVGPCCFLVRVRFNAPGTYTWVRVAKAGSITSAAPNAGFTNVAFVPLASATFTPAAVPFFPGAGWHTLGVVCFNAGGMVTITTNGLQCPPINLFVICNGPIGGGNPVGGGGLDINIPNGGLDIGLGKGSADDAVVTGLGTETMTISPNPAETISTIRFTTPQVTNNVTVSITDITGREVLRVLDGATLAKGAQEIPVSTEGLMTGMYQVTMHTEGTLLYTATLSVVR